MRHDDVEELLAAYALDAVDPDEAKAVDDHLAECPRCRAEVARHREVASMFASSPEPAPEALWQRISAQLNEPQPEYEGAPPLAPIAPIERLRQQRDARLPSRRVVAGGLGAIAAIAAALVVVFALQVGHLDGKIGKMQAAVGRQGLSGAVTSALLEPHTLATLTSSSGNGTAEVVLTSSGQDYWVQSSLPVLPADRTYQLWALVGGKPVSVGLIGNRPDSYAAFRLEAGATRLMVTAEPSGGAPAPTTRVLVQKAVSL